MGPNPVEVVVAQGYSLTSGRGTGAFDAGVSAAWRLESQRQSWPRSIVGSHWRAVVSDETGIGGMTPGVRVAVATDRIWFSSTLQLSYHHRAFSRAGHTATAAFGSAGRALRGDPVRKRFGSWDVRARPSFAVDCHSFVNDVPPRFDHHAELDRRDPR